jgi:hypothetical protein
VEDSKYELRTNHTYSSRHDCLELSTAALRWRVLCECFRMHT